VLFSVRRDSKVSKREAIFRPLRTQKTTWTYYLSLRTEIYTQRYFPSAGTENADGNGVHAVFFCIRSGRKRSMDTIFRF